MKTSQLEIIDTFPAYLQYWEKCRDLSLDEQIDRWAQDYLSPWPELLAKQIEDYHEQNVDWQQIAEERIFPELATRLPAMRLARENLLAAGEAVFNMAIGTLGVNMNAQFIIHVGIGCGAGWVTRYNEAPAILFGLENIAESGWSSRDAITGLVAHELGHLAHDTWRGRYSMGRGYGPWWQLYVEGFAQYCETIIQPVHGWHQIENNPDWLAWCQANQSWLSAEFLRRVDEDEPVTPFFGSWYDLHGRKETGYFLGCKAIQRLAKDCTVKEIALLDNIESALRPILAGWAAIRNTP